MEKDLIDDDRRQVAAFKPPPSLSDLHDLRKTLEKTLEDQVKSLISAVIHDVIGAPKLTLSIVSCVTGGGRKNREYTQQSNRLEFVCQEPNVRSEPATVRRKIREMV